MFKQSSYSSALEIERTLDLQLSGGQFETLASFIDGYQDSKEIIKELLLSKPKEVQNIIVRHARHNEISCIIKDAESQGLYEAVEHQSSDFD